MLLARLDRRLTLLTEGPRDLPALQPTLRATIDWGYELLDVGEQLLLGRLVVFAGGWTLDAAEQLCTAIRSLSTSILYGLHAGQWHLAGNSTAMHSLSPAPPAAPDRQSCADGKPHCVPRVAWLS